MRTTFYIVSIEYGISTSLSHVDDLHAAFGLLRDARACAREAIETGGEERAEVRAHVIEGPPAKALANAYNHETALGDLVETWVRGRKKAEAEGLYDVDTWTSRRER